MATTSPVRPPVFNVPNQLTAARLVLGVVLFAFIVLEYWLACTLIFAAAALTDWLDGYLARRHGLASTLGRLFDPLVDKVVVCGAYIFLLGAGPGAGLPPWTVAVVVARELVITGLRSFVETRGVSFGADWLGKLKMGLQCATLFAIFAALYVQARPESAAWAAEVPVLRDGLVYAMVGATALSGVQYVWRAAQLMRDPADEGRQATARRRLE